jgi:hypothetical protein
LPPAATRQEAEKKAANNTREDKEMIAKKYPGLSPVTREILATSNLTDDEMDEVVNNPRPLNREPMRDQKNEAKRRIARLQSGDTRG